MIFWIFLNLTHDHLIIIIVVITLCYCSDDRNRRRTVMKSKPVRLAVIVRGEHNFVRCRRNPCVAVRASQGRDGRVVWNRVHVGVKWHSAMSTWRYATIGILRFFTPFWYLPLYPSHSSKKIHNNPVLFRHCIILFYVQLFYYLRLEIHKLYVHGVYRILYVLLTGPLLSIYSYNRTLQII